MVRQQFGKLTQTAAKVIANPTDTYVQPHNIGPNTPPEFDLKPLSDTLAKFINEKNARDGEKEEAAGAAAWTNLSQDQKDLLASSGAKSKDPEQAHRRLLRGFNKLIENGAPEMSSPFAQRGFARASAGGMMTRFHNNVMARQADATTLVNNDDGTPQEAMSPQDIIDDEWSKIKDNVALQTTQGQLVASERFAATEREFMGRTVSGLAEEQRKIARTMKTDEIFTEVLKVGALDEGIKPSDLDGINAAITSAHEANMQGMDKVVTSAYNTAITELARTDPDAAEMVLDSLGGTMLYQGGSKVKYENTASGSLEISRMGRHIDSQRLRLEQQADRQLAVADRDALRAADGTPLLSLMNSYRDTGLADVDAAVQDFVDNGGDLGQVPKVTMHLQSLADRISMTDPSPGTRHQMEKLLVQGTLTNEMVRDAFDSNEIHSDTYFQFVDAIKEREERAASMEDSERYRQSRRSITDHPVPPGLNGPSTLRAGRLRADRDVHLQDAMHKWLGALGHEPTDEEHLQFLTDFDKETEKLLEAQNRVLVEEEASMIDALDEVTKAREVGPALALLEESRSKLDPAQHRKYKGLIESGANWDYSVRADSGYEDFKTSLNALGAELEGEDGLLPTEVDTFMTNSDRRLREAAAAQMQLSFSAHSGQPGAAMADYHQKLEAIGDAELERLKPELKGFRERVEKDEDGAVKTVNEQATASESLNRAKRFEAASAAGPEAVKTLLETSEFIDLSPDVSPGFRKAYVSLVSRERKNGEQAMTSARFQTFANDEVVRITNSSLSGEAKKLALSSIIRVSGLSEFDLLNGTLTRVYTTEQKNGFLAEMGAAQRLLDSPIAAKTSDRQVLSALQKTVEMRQKLDGITNQPYDLSAVDAYNTPIGDVMSWGKSPARIAAIMKRLGIPEADLDLFVDSQLRAAGRAR